MLMASQGSFCCHFNSCKTCFIFMQCLLARMLCHLQRFGALAPNQQALRCMFEKSQSVNVTCYEANVNDRINLRIFGSFDFYGHQQDVMKQMCNVIITQGSRLRTTDALPAWRATRWIQLAPPSAVYQLGCQITSQVLNCFCLGIIRKFCIAARIDLLSAE